LTYLLVLHPLIALCATHAVSLCTLSALFSFFFTDTATPEIYTLSLHDALPISGGQLPRGARAAPASARRAGGGRGAAAAAVAARSEEHTSELQSLAYLVCRLLLEKKNNLIRKRKGTMIPAITLYRPVYRELLLR